MLWYIFTAVIAIFISTLFRMRIRSKRLCPSSAFSTGKTIIITGATSGIGKAAAEELAKRKARIILACRNLKEAKSTALSISKVTKNEHIFAKELDLASFSSIRRFCDEIVSEEEKIDVLVNNAGVFQCPYMKTEDGLELQIGVNHFGHFLLTSLLLEKLKSSAPSRIVIVSSGLHTRGSIKFDDINSENSYDKAKAYADSKLANLLFAKELHKRLINSNVSVFSLTPGMVATSLGRHVVSPFALKTLLSIAVFLGLRDAFEGCQPIVYSCVSETLEGKSGIYIGKDCKESEWSSKVNDETTSKRLWSLSEQITGAKF